MVHICKTCFQWGPASNRFCAVFPEIYGKCIRTVLKSRRERCCRKGTFPKILNIWWERQRVWEGEYIRALYVIRIEQKWKGCSLRGALISSGMSARTRINTCEIVLGILHLMKKSGINLGMRRLVRPQHAQHQGELPKFRSSCQSCGIGATTRSQAGWPLWQHRADPGQGLCFATPCPTSAIPQQEGTRAGPSIISSRVLLAAGTDHSRGDGTGLCLRPAAQSKRGIFRLTENFVVNIFSNTDFPPGKHVVQFREMRKRAIFFL